MVHELYNLKMINEIAQGDQGFIMEMLVTFVESVTVEIEHVRSSMRMENWTSVAETAHKLASNFAYLGASNLHAHAVDLEKSVLHDHDLTGIAEKAGQLCDEGSKLLSLLKNDFDITD